MLDGGSGGSVSVDVFAVGVRNVKRLELGSVRSLFAKGLCDGWSQCDQKVKVEPIGRA